MSTSTRAVCWIAIGLWIVQGTLLIESGGTARAEGGNFGSGGFHGGSIGNAGNVGNYRPIPGGYSGWGYQVGPTGFEGGGGQASTSGGTKVYRGRDTGPPVELQDGRGVHLTQNMGDAEGPSWDTDWWSQDPRDPEEQAAGLSTGLAIGTAVESLPRRYETLYGESGGSYYFHSGTYYQAAEQGFQVVEAPLGIEVENLPSTAEMVAVDRQQYFVYKGTYYQAFFGGSGIVYKVVDDPNT